MTSPLATASRNSALCCVDTRWSTRIQTKQSLSGCPMRRCGCASAISRARHARCDIRPLSLEDELGKNLVLHRGRRQDHRELLKSLRCKIAWLSASRHPSALRCGEDTARGLVQIPNPGMATIRNSIFCASNSRVASTWAFVNEGRSVFPPFLYVWPILFMHRRKVLMETSKPRFNNAFTSSFQMTRSVSALSPNFEHKVLVICASSVNKLGSIAAGRPAPLSGVLILQRRGVSSWIEPKMSGHKNCARRKESIMFIPRALKFIPAHANNHSSISLAQRSPWGALGTDHSLHPLLQHRPPGVRLNVRQNPEAPA